MVTDPSPTPEEWRKEITEALLHSTDKQIESAFSVSRRVEEILAAWPGTPGVSAQAEAASEFDGPRALGILAAIHNIEDWDGWHRAVRCYFSPIEEILERINDAGLRDRRAGSRPEPKRSFRTDGDASI